MSHIEETMKIIEIYMTPEYHGISGQIKHHMDEVDRLLKELEAKFPPQSERQWIIMGDHLPRQMGVQDV